MILKTEKQKSNIMILYIYKFLGHEKSRLILADTKMTILLTTIPPYLKSCLFLRVESQESTLFVVIYKMYSAVVHF